MKTLTINGITINCIFSSLTDEHKAMPAHKQQGVKQYKDIQMKAVEEYFNDMANVKPLQDAGIAVVNINARIHLIRSGIVQLPMGLAYYEPALKQKPSPPQIPVKPKAIHPMALQGKSVPSEVIKKVEADIKENIIIKANSNRKKQVKNKKKNKNKKKI
jgi:hypothetical protein